MRGQSTSAGLIAVVGSLLVAVTWYLATPKQAAAIPAFARKYQTSCTTCHNDFPELNDFGEAFKKAGFRFPKDDDLFVKQPPVLLGARAQKEVFPEAVYPGEIPGFLPLGFRYSGFAAYNSRQPSALGFLPRTDLFMPNTFTVIAAGALGPSLSFWIDDDISAGGSGADGGLGDGYLKFNNLGHYIGLPKDALNVRFGQFELDLPFTQARTINLTDYDVYDEAADPGVRGACGAIPFDGCSTANPFVLGAPQRGIEIGGYPNDGNFEWSVSFVNGNNDGPAIRNSKDVYVRVSQRFNLERNAAERKAIQASGPTGPRDHTSVRFGAFYYYGRDELNMDQSLFTSYPKLGTMREPFYRAGGDVRFKYRNFEIYGLGMYGHDQNLLPNEGFTGFVQGAPVTFTGGFGEAEYWFYPWLIGLMRYDFVNSPTDVLNDLYARNTRNRFSPGFQVLVRANIKLAFEYQHRAEQPVPDSTFTFRPNGFLAGVDYAF